MAEKDKYSFDGDSEVKSSFVKFGKIGDKIVGTLIGRRQVPNQLLETAGAMQWLYELKVKEGSFHNIIDKVVDKEATVLEKDTVWTVGGKAAIDNAMRNAKIGQIVGFNFVEEKAPKVSGYNPTKVIKVHSFGMDETYQGEELGDEEGAKEIPV